MPERKALSMDNYPGNESAGAPMKSGADKPVKEYRLCLYADGRAELKPMEGGPDEEMAGMEQGFKESPGGSGAMV